MFINVVGAVSDAGLNTVFVFPTRDTSDGTFIVEENMYVPSLNRMVFLSADASASNFAILSGSTSPGITSYSEA